VRKLRATGPDPLRPLLVESPALVILGENDDLEKVKPK
jgi:hypothetical protein